ncbi:MAG TPA: hypothetical protein PKA23_10065 [Accumulibacter sp.]|uniref:hypothetical protein n=1 Tax=Accumulibacter sp. TaxID=2053492 RepID=UPI002BD34ABD|nr:hypothetical protein [Accumulibacter sp.]HMX69331.1 hypothetical protein [Accumulibacter sp.]HNI51102.1 hypothetical protein [Accumulibacter sp.]HNN85218.1 hypothetical protein [Accumulibacter sp.]
MLLADRRIELDARPAPPAPPVLEVVMLGHCPGPPADPARGAQWQRVAGDPAVLGELAELGFHRAARRLQEMLANPAGAAEPGDDALRALYRLPLPVVSLSQFRVLFPFAFDTPTDYVSVLAGDRAWLPIALQDFFEASTSLGREQLKLWVIRVPEDEGAAAFLPTGAADLSDPERLGAFERALLPRRAGLLALPDLERLQVPANLPDVPRLRLDNPLPGFLPCGVDFDDEHRERRNADEMVLAQPSQPLPAAAIVAPLARTLARLRPDMLCLLGVPLALPPAGELPVPAPEFLAYVGELVARPIDEGLAGSESAGALRHLQLLYPYLRAPGRPLASPSGLIAGMQALVAQQHGAWRSIGERRLPGRSLPWPVLSQNEATRLRESPGVTVLLRRNGGNYVDDERLCMPCLPLVALRRMNSAERRREHWRSAEVMRFIGWLQRELRSLGERLVFFADRHDARPELALRAFFNRLHALGALRGARPEDAYRLAQRSDGESTLIFDLEIAPAYPLDLIRITFLQDRHTASVRSLLEAVDG